MSLSANSEHIIGFRLRLAIVIHSLLSVVVFPLPAQSASDTHLMTDTEQSTAGYYRLSWQITDSINQDVSFELQQSISDDFSQSRTIYKGIDTARVISGKPNGDYYYRIRITDNSTNPWSNTIKVTVEHHSLGRAVIFFITGAVVFLITLLYIIRQPQR